MYVEITARQTGKTTRLIEAAFQHIKNGGTAAIISFNLKNSQRIVKEIHRKIDETFYFPQSANLKSRVTSIAANEGSLRGRCSDERRFWDEFIFTPYIEWRNQDYYCSSDKGFSPNLVINTENSVSKIDEQRKSSPPKSNKKRWTVLMTHEGLPWKILQTTPTWNKQVEITVDADCVKLENDLIIFKNNNDDIVAIINKKYLIWLGSNT